MEKVRKANSTRKPPAPSDDHGEIDEWIRGVMPGLHPLVARLDELIRETIPSLQFAIKWSKAYYGLPEMGWILEMVSYDVSVNVVFLAGAELDPPPPLGTGPSRYVKLRNQQELDEAQMHKWVKQAGSLPGWK